MSFFCFHDWVAIRKPVHDNKPYDHKILHEGEPIARFEFTGAAQEFIAQNSDYICSKCDKLDLRLDKAAQKARKLQIMQKRRDEARERGKKYLKLFKKAQE